MPTIKNEFRTTFVTAVGFLLGMAIWWASPRLTGHTEPWDANSHYYSLSLLIAGFTAALAHPKRFWLAPIGIYFGQFVYAFLYLPGGPLWILGLLFGVFYCLLAMLGAGAAYGLSRMIRRSRLPTGTK